MDSNDLSTDQARVLYRGIVPSLRYLFHLSSRMEKVGFGQDDPLFQLVARAYDAVHHLSVHVHYMGCESGVNREPPRKR